jgi:hypothetical protein
MRAAGVAKKGTARRWPAEQRRRREEHVPLAAGQHRVGAPQRVDGEALVEVEPALGPLLHHLDELVAGLLLVDEAGLCFDHPRRYGEERRNGGRRDEPRGEPAAAQQRQGGEGDDRRGAQHRALRADQRDGEERREERPQDAAGGGEREDAAGDAAGVGHAGRRQPDGERRDHAEQHDGRREQRERRRE